MGAPKGSNSTSTVTIPPEVLAQYQAVNAKANATANTPFQTYGGQFVAPLTSTQQAGISGTNAAANQAQPYFDAATGQLISAQNATSPYYSAATSDVGAGQNVGNALAGASLSSLYGGQSAANDLQSAASSNYGTAYTNAQPANAAAATSYYGALGAAQPYIGQAGQTIGQAQGIGQALGAASYGTLNGATSAAAPYQTAAGTNYGAAYAGAQPYNIAAGGQYAAGSGMAAPLNQAANQNINNAYAGAQPYQGASTAAALAGGQAVNADPITGQTITQYLSPYLGTVLGSTEALINQQNQQQQAGQLGSAISSGAFGGDRAGIAAANLAQTQELAAGNIYSGILNTGYNNALGVAQQQQGVNLGASQANRAAVQGMATQLQGIGQQGYTQGMGAAAAQQGLGQTEFGQAETTGQNVANLGQQVFGQGSTLGTEQQGLGAQLYGQGLSTAQQQAALGSQLFGQGATTAAQQAALGAQEFGIGSTTGQNLAALGQQQYAQGMGLGAAQQGLGSQVYGQGATTAAQEAALGQQQFGQDITASGQQAALGQDIYGTGAATSAALAGLGTGAQGAALQGAQAQLAAGTAEQQTQQAQDTALYNQYLQQQSYPFQVDQFLANIAEGTGALSGSTTTTNATQNGIFSDERLKEDIEPIGKTFDGQNIVKFRYKGSPKTQIGLIAQDVERKHPDAVGLAGGYRMVDYDRATEKAAARGHFAEGGLARAAYAYGGYPMLPGMYPADMGAILQSQAQMYGPYSGGGLYGGAASGAPHGGSSYVPQATLPVSHLAVSNAQAPNIANGGQEAQRISQLATALGKGVDWAKGHLGGNSDSSVNILPVNDNQDDSLSFDPIGSARGGRAGYDIGGSTPYGDNPPGPGLDIPNDPNVHQLAVANTGNANNNSGGGLGSAIGAIGSIASTAAKILPFFGIPLASGGLAGGRHGYDDGGAPQDDGGDVITDALGNILPGLTKGTAAAINGAGQLGRQAVAGFTGDPSVLLSSNNAGAQAVNAARNALGPDQNALSSVSSPVSAQSPSINPAVADNAIAAGQRVVAGGARGSGLGAGQSTPFVPTVGPSDPRDATQITPQGVAAAMKGPIVPPGAPSPAPAGLGAAQTGPAYTGPISPQTVNPTGPLDTTVTNQGAMTSQGPSVGLAGGTNKQAPAQGENPILHGVEGALAKIPHALSDPNTLLPILAGLAAFGTAPTRSLGYAIASGVGAGANTAIGMRQQQAQIGLEQAQTGATQASTFNTMQQAYANRGLMLVEDPNGNIPVGPKKYRAVPIGAAISPNLTGPAGQQVASSTGSAEPAFNYLGHAGAQAAQAAFPRASMLTPVQLDEQSKQIDQIQADGYAAQSRLPQLQRWATSIANTQGTPEAPGALQDIRQQAVNYYNTAVGLMFPNDPAKAQALQINGLGDAQMATKLTTGQAAGLEGELGQRSFASLAALLKGTPNLEMQSKAALTLVADGMADTQQKIDEANYMKEFTDRMGQVVNPAMSRNFYAQDAVNAFNQDFGPERYEAERQKLYDAISSKNFSTVNQLIQDPKTRVQTEHELDRQSGLPGFHAYFTGNRAYE